MRRPKYGAPMPEIRSSSGLAPQPRAAIDRDPRTYLDMDKLFERLQQHREQIESALSGESAALDVLFDANRLLVGWMQESARNLDRATDAERTIGVLRERLARLRGALERADDNEADGLDLAVDIMEGRR